MGLELSVPVSLFCSGKELRCVFALAISMYTDYRSPEEHLVGGRMSLTVLVKFSGLNK